MASVERIDLVPCPACRRHVIPPPPESVRPWVCPFCRRRFRRRLQSSESSGTIPCFDLFSKKPWPPDEPAPRRGFWHPARWGSAALSAYAGSLIGLMIAYHVVMTVLTLLWLVARAPVVALARVFAAESCGAEEPRTSPWLEPLRTWLPHFRHDDPDMSIGPTLLPEDAPGVFVIVTEVARKVGSAPPDEIRMTYVPCCGVLEQRSWGGFRSRRRVLVIGLPLLYVLSIEELRAVVAHELAHLSRGDAALAFVVSQFLESLDQSIALGSGTCIGWLHPCALFARLSARAFRIIASPLSRHQEHRADAQAAAICGADVVAGSLRIVALVQPVFKEVLCHYHPAVIPDANLYEFFRTAWASLQGSLREEIQDSMAVEERAGWFDPHPTLRARLACLARFEPHQEPDPRPARRLLTDRRKLEALLHTYIYSSRAPRLSLFHPAED